MGVAPAPRGPHLWAPAGRGICRWGSLIATRPPCPFKNPRRTCASCRFVASVALPP